MNLEPVPLPASRHAIPHLCVRGFWHGAPAGPYQLLCLASFAGRGHAVEVFTYDPGLAFPGWITRRDARDILPGEHVQHYRTGFGAGSPSLHSNLFRYAMLQRHGGWWIDLDVLLLTADLPGGDYFFAQAAAGFDTLNTAVLKFPPGHALLADAINACRATAEDAAVWGQTGPQLLTRLVNAHAMRPLAHPSHTAYPIPWREVGALFDPARREWIEARCDNAVFLHLFNEIWRGAGIPQDLGPPAGSFLDHCFRRHDAGHRFAATMRLPDVTRWIENRREKITLNDELASLTQRHAALERRHAALGADYDELTRPSWFRRLATVLARTLRPHPAPRRPG